MGKYSNPIREVRHRADGARQIMKITMSIEFRLIFRRLLRLMVSSPHLGSLLDRLLIRMGIVGKYSNPIRKVRHRADGARKIMKITMSIEFRLIFRRLHRLMVSSPHLVSLLDRLLIRMGSWENTQIRSGRCATEPMVLEKS